jgi:SRSO17 transposase
MPAAAMAGVVAIDEHVVRPSDIDACLDSLTRFTARYQPFVSRSEQAEHLAVYVEGLVSGLERKSIEPIATAHGLYRRPLQHFVGAGKWSDTAVRSELRRHVADEIGDPDGVLIMDGSGFEKSGPESVGVARQWCGRLGKVENCQVGVFLAYSTLRGAALLDAELYLPDSWINNDVGRRKAHVPAEVTARTSWELADAMLQRVSAHVPHAWVLGDDEFGRPKEFRDRLADRGERYLLEVPSNTLVRRPVHWPGRRRTWRTVSRRAHDRAAGKWQHLTLRNGAKGPIEVLAFATPVETKRDGAAAREETLLIMKTIGGSKTWYFLAPAGTPPDPKKLVAVAARRHGIEEVFEVAKGEVGLDHYEVRSWVGWHHHMTLSMLALWYLVLERRRLGKKHLH